MQDIFTLVLVSATFVASFLFTMVIAWGIYAYSVYDAHLHYVPRIETEIAPGGGAVKLSWSF